MLFTLISDVYLGLKRVDKQGLPNTSISITEGHCVVPENIHTPTIEGIGNSKGVVVVWGWGVQRAGPGNSRVEGYWMIKTTFQGVNFKLSPKIASN